MAISKFSLIQRNGSLIFSKIIIKDLYCPTTLQTKRFKIRGYTKIPYGDEDAMKVAVATYGPVAVAIDASDWGFAYYSSGIYSSTTCKTNVHNHAVLIVGYGTEGGLDYWVIKNSWGARWGQVCFNAISLFWFLFKCSDLRNNFICVFFQGRLYEIEERIKYVRCCLVGFLCLLVTPFVEK